MGPIELELRSWSAPVIHGEACVYALSSPAHHVYFNAWLSLRKTNVEICHPQSDRFWPDIMSEAIEAAEALSL